MAGGFKADSRIFLSNRVELARQHDFRFQQSLDLGVKGACDLPSESTRSRGERVTRHHEPRLIGDGLKNDTRSLRKMEVALNFVTPTRRRQLHRPL